MTTEQLNTVNEMLAVMAKPPVAKLQDDGTFDAPVILIDNGYFTIREGKIERKTIAGTKEMDGFVLEKSIYYPSTRFQPEEYDFKEIFSNQNFYAVANKAVQACVEEAINGILEQRIMDMSV